MCCHEGTPQVKKSELLLTLAAVVVVLYAIFDIASNPSHPPENHIKKAQYDG